MFKFQMNSKGIALYLVLTILIIVVIFANIILTLVLNQSQLTQHQVRRIQAYYAAQSGINYALEALRLNDPNWTTTTNSITHIICRDITGVAPCTAGNLTPPTPNVIEYDFPKSINYVSVTVGPLTSGNRTVSATANYLSTQ